MAYRALEKMQERNLKNLGISDRPTIPELPADLEKNTLSWCALTFLRDMCEDLRFDTLDTVCKTKRQRENVLSLSDCLGRSFSAKQIPFEMEMDLDRLCLERTLGDFLADGSTHHAYLVYFCFIEMFWKNTVQPRKLIELLSDFEKKTSPLLRNHRDHFVHSVYVFSIGLAIYQQSEAFRNAYAANHTFTDKHQAAHSFLQFWGLTALFHDLGYPFELSFEQIENCFEGRDIPNYCAIYRHNPKADPGLSNSPYQEFYQKMIAACSSLTITGPYSANKLFSAILTEQFYSKFSCCLNYQAHLEEIDEVDTKDAYYSYLLRILDHKACAPWEFDMHMDHAYFSAYVLLHLLWEPGKEHLPGAEYLNSLTAILLHNSMFKYSILKDADTEESYPRLEMDSHPLAYLLMLCDELQCWNRFGYGRETKRENHPFTCKLLFHNNSIKATYFFDAERKAERTGTYAKFCGPAKPHTFLGDIEKVLMINGASPIKLSVSKKSIKNEKVIGEPLSESNFSDLYYLATLLNAEYRTRDEYNDLHKPRERKKNALTERERLKMFDQLSLEYKLANLYQVLRFASHLDRIGCFFTDRQMSFQEQAEFTNEQLKDFGRWEHKSWANQKREMGWQCGNRYRDADEPIQNKLREQLREHEFLDVPFGRLEKEKQQKDMDPFNLIQEYMKEYFQVRIYKLR